MKLNVKAFGMACGLMWGLTLFIATWWVIMRTGASGSPTMIGRVYIGYTVSTVGSFIGLAWGLVDGWIGGMIFAWLYNWFVDKGGAQTA
ncbi:MAG TPA: bacteriophage holin [Gemmatimonadaceae bacterium]|nr:bacteriophage holin [Gemmatimonadaceae bacterium]